MREHGSAERHAQEPEPSDALVRDEIAAAIREADDPHTVWVPQDAVKDESKKRRAEWRSAFTRNGAD